MLLELVQPQKRGRVKTTSEPRAKAEPVATARKIMLNSTQIVCQSAKVCQMSESRPRQLGSQRSHDRRRRLLRLDPLRSLRPCP